MLKNKFFTYLSPAKLNLGLKIIGKRQDGYHLLKSIFCLINLFDEINISTTNDGKISIIEHHQAWHYQDDLAYKAAALLQEYTQSTSYGVNIKIKKTIPSGSGMGGGSSNAATVLMVLNRLWNIHLSKNQLLPLGEQLGADVPFFIFGHNAIVSGIGEQLEPITIPQTYFVIVKPSFHIPTKTIFGNVNFDSLILNPNITADELLTNKPNDLLPTAIKIYPQLKHLIDNLQRFGSPSMTGTGSALYLSFKDKNQAINAEQAIKDNFQYQTFLAHSLEESPLFE